MNQLKMKLAAITFSISVMVLFFEIALRFLPYNSGLVAAPVNAENPVYRFLPDREIRYSQDWDMKNGRTRQINKAGFLSDVEYNAADTQPLLAVIGDSYIEAIQVDWDESVHGQLHAELSPDIRTYGFGASYAGLAQYMSWAEFAGKTYKPDMMVVNVVPNDYLQRLPKPGQPLTGGFLGMSTFVRTSDGSLDVQPTERPEEPLLKTILRQSAIVNYLYRNMSITALPAQIRSAIDKFSSSDQPKYIANTDAIVSEEEFALARAQIDLFLNRLPQRSGLAKAHILLTIDGIRPALYDAAELEKSKDTFPAVIERYLIKAGREAGYEVIALREHFVARHIQTGDVFEFPFNNHWNANGHNVMSNAVLSSETFKRSFP